uniref:Uncharacterized protein n=1 Tax=Cucumis melo TaxID=3656 RepID=A0A9I9ELC5_CUCME
MKSDNHRCHSRPKDLTTTISSTRITFPSKSPKGFPAITLQAPLERSH